MRQEQIRLPERVTVRDPNGDHYMIAGLLGEGASGAVYLVRNRRLKQHVFALKEVINPDKAGRERFTFEGEVLQRLQHRALPRVHRVFEHQKLKRVYLLMDYIKGCNLEDLQEEQPDQCFSWPLVLTLMTPIVDALIYLHRQNPPVVHRDIKPANIIVPVGADEAVLVDFGSAKEYTVGGTTTVACHRSPGYAAPEQYGSGTSPRTDIYGLGATLYKLLTGTLPPDALLRVARSGSGGVDPLKPAHLLRPTVPPAGSEALQRALSLSSAHRFETIEEFWQVLNAPACQQQEQRPQSTSEEVPADAPYPLAEQSTQERPPTGPVQRRQPVPRSKQRKALLILLALLGTIALVPNIFAPTWGLPLLLLLGMGIPLLLLKA